VIISLLDGGKDRGAGPINDHRGVRDSGGKETVGDGFLQKPVKKIKIPLNPQHKGK